MSEPAPVLGDPQTAEALFGAVSCEVLAPRRALLSAQPEESIQDAVNRLWWNKVGSLPVVSEGELVGGFAEEDLLRVLGDRLGEAEPGHGRIWGELLADLSVVEVMTPVDGLPVVDTDTALLDGLHASCAPGMPQGRYLYVRSAGDDPVSVVSYRDVSRLLIQLHDGDAVDGTFPDAASARRAREAAEQALDVSIAEARQRGLGHKPNTIGLRASGTEIVRTLVAGGRGYVLAVLADGEPYGICTRRDLLRVCVRRYANLDQVRIGSVMTHRVRTVSDANTLAGLIKLMALASCRHMPVVDEWDRVGCVISLWECVAGISGSGPVAG